MTMKQRFAWLLTLPAAALAQPASAPEPDPERLQVLYRQLRCLVCQNGSLVDSQAPLALDLKREIALRVAAGDSDRGIIDFLVQRYGEFISYQPPLEPATWLLWLGPLLLLLGGAAWLFRQRRHGPVEPEEPVDPP
ncbi:cytochrome c-type biogenesis protein CcmH [Ideonella azotifigens]|uniref:Cytochrome c-type biogenesis protein n=1 Tax=Ideonella azotifigens TaxID=513160 RepID=A0ABN1KGH9_9BURK|nr:cytochrome c-type biogenesis protein [Ideonella azotifigens]MCD2340481.1 cytochrome c-type biogenesis protein CcmH [Ideonella azotifigens]